MINRRFTMVLTTVIAVSAIASCSNDHLLGINQGRVRVFLSGDGGGNSAADVAGADAASVDAGSTAVPGHHDDDDEGEHDRASRWFHAANVTLSSILVRNLDGELLNLDVDLPITVDVVQIEGGKVIQLPDAALPIGTYDQVVLVMTALQGVTRDGTVITIEPPGGGWTAIVAVCPFEVALGGTATVGIELMVRNAFKHNGNHFQFQPRFRSASCSDDVAGAGVIQ